MKKFVFVLTIVLVCMMLVSCGSAQRKRNGSVSSSENGSEGTEQVEEPHWSEKAAKPMTWDEAKKHCETLNEKDFSDWRLPSKNELLSLRHGNQSDFGDTETFWTSELVGGEGSEMVRTVEFRFGRKESYSKSQTFFVRCVR